MNRDNTREQNLLDHYWDADADNRQYIPDELEPSLRQTVDQFHAEDDAPEPDQEFVDRLWSDLAGDTTVTASTTSPPWTSDPNDEPTEPQYVPERQEDPLQTKQQSIWRRRARQIGELVAGVLVLALVTGGLILAYQNLLGTGEESAGIAGFIESNEQVLLFTGETGDSHSIFLASDDGSVVEPITDDAGNDFVPTWSPDGAQIAFFRSPPAEEMASTGSANLMVNPYPSPELYVMDADGDNLRRLSDSTGRVSAATWSPDGSEIIVSVDHDSGGLTLRSFTVETGSSRDIVDTDWADLNLETIRGTTWAPDGTRFAFIGAEPDSVGQIFVAESDGSNLTAITEAEETGLHGPANWSPDGQQLTFTIGSPRPNVVVVDADGSNRRNLTNHDRTDTSPVWSPDGNRIVFSSQFSSAGDRGIYVAEVAGEQTQPLVETEGSDSTPVWSSDGAAIAFVSQFTEGGFHSEQEWHVQVVDADGSNLRTISEQGSHPGAPEWRPIVDDTADEMPTPEQDESSSNVPDQEPREIVIEIVNALGDDDWDRVRDVSISQLQNFNDSAIRSTTVGDLPNIVLARMTPLDSIDHWTVEHREDWSVVRHIDQPSVAFVFVEDGGEWRLHPGFHNVSRAQIISDIGPEGLREYSQPVALGNWEGDADPIQISSSIEGRIAAVRVSESVLDVAVQLRFHPAEEAILSVDNIRWSTDGAEGQAQVLQTNASKTDRLVDFPLTPGDGGIYWMILRASDVPEEASNLIFTLNEIQINGLERTDVDADDMVVNGAFDAPNQTVPDLSDISSTDSSPANLPVHFPRQSEEVIEHDSGAPQGTLAMDEQGCLRFGDEDGPVIIWPHSGYAMDVIEGEIALIDEETGDVIAFVGDEVSFHGSDPEFAPDSIPDHMLDGPIPEACADAEGYFVTGPGIGTP